MTLKDSVLARLNAVIKGSCVFDKQDIAEAIKNFHVVHCNDVVLTERLEIFYDDCTLVFNLIWQDLGPRHTLIEIIPV